VLPLRPQALHPGSEAGKLQGDPEADGLSAAPWRAVYADERVYEERWPSLPPVGVVRVDVLWPSEDYRVVFSGWDIYWLSEEPAGLRVGAWKEDDPADPYYRKGFERWFGLDGETNAIVYRPMEEWSGVPAAARKRGVWVDDALARKLGVL